MFLRFVSIGVDKILDFGFLRYVVRVWDFGIVGMKLIFCIWGRYGFWGLREEFEGLKCFLNFMFGKFNF